MLGHRALDKTSQVARAIHTLQQHTDEFDSIAVQGVSGLVIGPIVAHVLHRPLVVVRKPAEFGGRITRHYNAGNRGERVLFLDSLISKGETRERVRAAVEQDGTRLVASYLTSEDEYEEAA